MLVSDYAYKGFWDLSWPAASSSVPCVPIRPLFPVRAPRLCDPDPSIAVHPDAHVTRNMCIHTCTAGCPTRGKGTPTAHLAAAATRATAAPRTAGLLCCSSGATLPAAAKSDLFLS